VLVGGYEQLSMRCSLSFAELPQRFEVERGSTRQTNTKDHKGGMNGNPETTSDLRSEEAVVWRSSRLPTSSINIRDIPQTSEASRPV
jgi:hypothetical protein